MKKVYLILTLFVVSLFFFSSKVYAATYTFEISEEATNLINDDFFTFREKVINYSKENDYAGYLIFKGTNSSFHAFLFHSDYSFYIDTTYVTDKSQSVPYYYKNVTQVYLKSGEIYVHTSHTSGYYSQSFLYPGCNYSWFIDTDIPLIYKSSNTYLLIFKDTTYTISKGIAFPTLYQIYLDHNVPDEPVDRFLEDKEMINNFYSVIFTKIGELATNFANNYIFLLIFGIFILIFIFEIIRRRLL